MHYLALRLHMPVSHLLVTMTLAEITRWQAYFELQREMREGIGSPELQREQLRDLANRRKDARRARLELVA